VKIPHRVFRAEASSTGDAPANLGSTLGEATSLEEELPKMDHNAQEELKAHLVASDEEYRRLSVEHSYYDRRIEEIESKPHLSQLDEVEEQRLKKIKLRLKDQMEAILLKYKTQMV